MENYEKKLGRYTICADGAPQSKGRTIKGRRVIAEDYDSSYDEIFTLKNLCVKDENGKIELDENKNPKTQTEYSGYLFISSPYDKFSKYKDTLPTTNYLVETLEEPFNFESYNLNVTIKDGGLDSDKINNYLLNYQPESYRKNIFGNCRFN